MNCLCNKSCCDACGSWCICECIETLKGEQCTSIVVFWELRCVLALFLQSRTRIKCHLQPQIYHCKIWLCLPWLLVMRHVSTSTLCSLRWQRRKGIRRVSNKFSDVHIAFRGSNTAYPVKAAKGGENHIGVLVKVHKAVALIQIACAGWNLEWNCDVIVSDIFNSIKHYNLSSYTKKENRTE